MPNTSTRAVVGWPDALAELVNNSAVITEHRTLMGAVIQGVRSIHSGLNDAVQGVLTGFEVSQVMLFSHKLDLVLSFEYAISVVAPETLQGLQRKPAKDLVLRAII